MQTAKTKLLAFTISSRTSDVGSPRISAVSWIKASDIRHADCRSRRAPPHGPKLPWPPSHAPFSPRLLLASRAAASPRRCALRPPDAARARARPRTRHLLSPLARTFVPRSALARRARKKTRVRGALSRSPGGARSFTTSLARRVPRTSIPDPPTTRPRQSPCVVRPSARLTASAFPLRDRRDRSILRLARRRAFLAALPS